MNTKRASQLICTLAVTATAACGKSAAADNGLARDLAAAKGSTSGLELAPRAGASQVVVSAIEGGPQAAPARTAHAPAAKPAARPAPSRAAPQSVAPPIAPAPHAAVAATSSAPAHRATSERAPDPAPLPPASSAENSNRERQRGTYSTEADIFRRMPWIRP